MDLIPTVDELIQRCPEKDGCTLFPAIREKIMSGEWGDALRYFRQMAPCGLTARNCPGATALEMALLMEERGRLRGLWQDAFGDKPLEIDFVCSNRTKLEAIKEAMKLVDVIPLSFSLTEHPSGRYDVVRFTVEL